MSSNRNRDIANRKRENEKKQHESIWTEHKASEFGVKCAMLLHSECKGEECACLCHGSCKLQ